MRHILTNALLIGFSTYCLWQMLMIAKHGGVILIEPNPYILKGELVFLSAIIVFAISNLRRGNV